MITDEILIEVVKDFGWGPKNEVPIFRREGRGWRLGNGLVVAIPKWANKVPDDTVEALQDIINHCNMYRGDGTNWPLLSMN